MTRDWVTEIWTLGSLYIKKKVTRHRDIQLLVTEIWNENVGSVVL